MYRASLIAQWVKNLTALQETQEMQVQSLDPENPWKKEMATHSSILAWRILWTEEPGGLQSMELQRARHDWATNTFSFSNNNGNTLYQNEQYWIYLESILPYFII